MRYFAVRITDPVTGDIYVPTPDARGVVSFKLQPYAENSWTYTSLNAGARVTTVGGANPAAPLVELDIPVGPLHTPGAAAFFRIHGISLGEISQAANLNGKNIAIYAGMSKGLPLANPAQAGLIASGTIMQSVGSWVGTDMNLSFYVAARGSGISSAQTTGNPAGPNTPPVASTRERPTSIIFNWLPGQTLISAITQSLSTAYLQYNVVGNINSSLVRIGEPKVGFYSTLTQFAGDIHRTSVDIIQGYAPVPNSYQGVWISLFNNTFVVQDGTTTNGPKLLSITDFVGQTAWQSAFEAQAIVVMRADLQVGDIVTLPPEPISTPVQFPGAAGQKNSLSFSGDFVLKSLRHVGNSRGRNGVDWVTVLDLILKPTKTNITGNAVPISNPAFSSGGANTRLGTAAPAFPQLYKANGFGFYLPN